MSDTRIAIVVMNNSGMGGAERRLARLYAELRQRKAPVLLATNASLWQAVCEAGILDPAQRPDCLLEPRAERLARRLAAVAARLRCPPLHRGSFWMRKLDYLLGCFSIGRWLLRERPALLHVALGGAYVVLPLQLLRLAPPTIVSVVGPLRDMVGTRVGLWLYRAALRRARIVDALSETVRDSLLREGVDARRIMTAPGSCVDTRRFRPAEQKRPWVVFSGRLIAEKDPLLFVEAARLVRPRVARLPELRFFILGDGPLRAEVEAALTRYGLEPDVDVGWVDQVEKVLAEAAVFVSLQRTDNYPSQALLEAMAAGAAVVATDVGGTARLVDEGVGIRTEPRAEQVAAAIAKLLENPARTATMGLRARERVMREHSMERYLEYLDRLYRCGA